MTAIDSAVH